MTKFFYNNFYFKDKILLNVLSFFIVLSVIALPCIYSMEHFMIGGDWVIPLYAEPLQMYLYSWIDRQNGEYFIHNFYPYYFLYTFLDLLTSDVYLKAIFLVFILRLIGAIGIYKIISELSNNGTNIRKAIIITFYLLSPAFYNGQVYWTIYYILPWHLYFAVKIIKNNRIEYIDVLGISILIFLSSLDLPNPKYLFYTFLIYITIFIVGLSLKKVKLSYFFENKFKLILLLLISSYLIFPQLFFLFYYDPLEYGVGIKRGYVNTDTTAMMDYGSATIDRMFRLFHDGMVLEHELKNIYLNSPVLITLNYFFIISISIFWFLKKDKGFNEWLLISLFLVFLFFSVGPNLPLGKLYEIIVTSNPVFAFLRTTAGAVFILSLVYTSFLFLFLNYINKIIVDIIFLIIVLIIAFPMLTGDYYTGLTNHNNAFKNEIGVKIPEKYFKLKPFIESNRLDAKIFVPNSNLTYISTNWGYVGPFSIFHFLYNGVNFIGNNKLPLSKLPLSFSKHNIGYVLIDKNIISNYSHNNREFKDYNLIFNENDIFLYQTFNSDNYWPHIYSCNTEIINSNFEKIIYSISNDNPYKIECNLPSSTGPIIEYKKITPTKYRVIFHKVNSNFVFALTEAYHSLWNASIVQHKDDQEISKQLIIDNYNILANNESTQVKLNNLFSYIENGYISSVYNNGMKTKDIDFISKIKFRTIQNENLSNGSIIEQGTDTTKFLKHFKMDKYFNGWLVTSEKIKKDFPNLIKVNEDDSFDFELIIEFFPQKVFYYSLFTTIFAFIFTIFLVILKRNRENGKNG